jgi:3-keto-L-gulonate-6-phosphate decarboxylase
MELERFEMGIRVETASFHSFHAPKSILSVHSSLAMKDGVDIVSGLKRVFPTKSVICDNEQDVRIA